MVPAHFLLWHLRSVDIIDGAKPFVAASTIRARKLAISLPSFEFLSQCFLAHQENGSNWICTSVIGLAEVANVARYRNKPRKPGSHEGLIEVEQPNCL